MKNEYLHIICFDVPFPANYGGAIDVFHTIRSLHNQGVKIILHCFEYGDRLRANELNHLCEKTYYYKRNTSLLNHLSLLPFNVKSRINAQLKENLLKDEYPILFEVLHTCYYLDDVNFKNRFKIYRHSNIEHDYFNELAKTEKLFLKKMYLKLEAFKLKYFEDKLHHASLILSVSDNDLNYFKNKFPHVPSFYLPSFNKFDELTCTVGKGNYILYHGNLSISENYSSASWLIDEVFSKLNSNVIIAGLNAPAFLINKISLHKNITLKQNCTEAEMQQLINEAHIHCLYTAQSTGLKLKLLNVLFSGKFVLANNNMLVGTQLKDACVICNTPTEYISNINVLMHQTFTQADIDKRELMMQHMKNSGKIKILLDLLNRYKY